MNGSMSLAYAYGPVERDYSFEISAFREMRQNGCRHSRVKSVARRLHGQLRQEFVRRLACRVSRRFAIVRRCEALVWLGDDGRLCSVVPLDCHSIIPPEMPLIFSLSINYLTPHASRACLKRLGWCWPHHPVEIHEDGIVVVTTPEELLSFVPWVARVVDDPVRGRWADPPVPCSRSPEGTSGRETVLTDRVREELDAYTCIVEERRRRGEI